MSKRVFLHCSEDDDDAGGEWDHATTKRMALFPAEDEWASWEPLKRVFAKNHEWGALVVRLLLVVQRLSRQALGAGAGVGVPRLDPALLEEMLMDSLKTFGDVFLRAEPVMGYVYGVGYGLGVPCCEFGVDGDGNSRRVRVPVQVDCECTPGNVEWVANGMMSASPRDRLTGKVAEEGLCGKVSAHYALGGGTIVVLPGVPSFESAMLHGSVEDVEVVRRFAQDYVALTQMETTCAGLERAGERVVRAAGGLLWAGPTADELVAGLYPAYSAAVKATSARGLRPICFKHQLVEAESPIRVGAAPGGVSTNVQTFLAMDSRSLEGDERLARFIKLAVAGSATIRIIARMQNGDIWLLTVETELDEYGDEVDPVEHRIVICAGIAYAESETPAAVDNGYGGDVHDEPRHCSACRSRAECLRNHGGISFSWYVADADSRRFSDYDSVGQYLRRPVMQYYSTELLRKGNDEYTEITECFLKHEGGPEWRAAVTLGGGTVEVIEAEFIDSAPGLEVRWDAPCEEDAVTHIITRGGYAM